MHYFGSYALKASYEEFQQVLQANMTVTESGRFTSEKHMIYYTRLKSISKSNCVS
jgi:hypothetical protein